MDKKQIKKFIKIGESPHYILIDDAILKEFREIHPKDLLEAAKEMFTENDKLYGLPAEVQK